MSSSSFPVANPDDEALDRFAKDPLTEKGAFESTVVDTAARLLMQLNRDSHPRVQAKIVDYYHQFAQELAASYSPGDTAAQVQAAMESVSQYSGLGPDTKIAEAVLYHASSVNGIYEFNISSAYKKVKALVDGSKQSGS